MVTEHFEPLGRNAVKRFALLVAALVAGIFFARLVDPETAETAPVAELTTVVIQADVSQSPTFEQLVGGSLKIVDLAWPLNKDSAYWPGENYKPFEIHDIATLEKDGVLSKAFSTPEHLGTHIDAPNHFERNQPSVDKIEPQQLFAPGVMIDVSNQVSLNHDYQLSLADVQAWEKLNGRIPEGAVVLLYTGWSRFWGNTLRYQNRDVMGVLHFPAFGVDAVKFLLAERKVRGIGLDTMSIDFGPSRDFAIHHLVNRAGRYGLENVAHLEQLPQKGFYLVVAPIKLEGGSGGPTRIFAILP